jgi:hypothetical protein
VPPLATIVNAINDAVGIGIRIRALPASPRAVIEGRLESQP